jgi:hypothetical protein
LKRGFDGCAYQSSQPGVFSKGMIRTFFCGGSAVWRLCRNE